MRRYLCLAFLFLNIKGGFAQLIDKATIQFSDSLFRQAARSPNDSVKIERLLSLSFFWCDRDTARAFELIRKAGNVMGARPRDYHQGLLHHFTANVVYTHDIERAKRLYMQADLRLSGSRFKRAYYYRAKAWNNYGTLLQIQDSASRYMDILIEKAIPYSRQAGDSIAVGVNLQNIGMLLGNVHDYQKAENYYKQAQRTLLHFNDVQEDKLTLFVNASKNALLAGAHSRARTYLDSARHQFNQIPHSNYAPHYYRTEGVYYRHKNNKSEALANLFRGLDAAERLSDEYLLKDINFEIYATYRDFGEFALAKKYLLTSSRYEPNKNLHNRLLLAREMANTEYRLGNYKRAYEQMQTYALGKDSLQEENMALKILELEKKYRTIEKENQILKLEDMNQKQALSMDKNKRWTILLTSGLLLALITAGFSWKLAHNNRQALLQKDLLHREEVINLKQQEKLHQYSSVLQAQEEERNRISRDLHDGLGGLLAGVKLRLSSIVSREKNRTGVEHPDIDYVIRDLDQSVDELRRIARNMMPESLLSIGLKPALADLCKYMQTSGKDIQFQAFNLQTSYSQPVLIGVYRIAQELLNNAVRHASARQIIVQCSENEGHLFLTVEDDGCGFDPTDMAKKGMGLSNIQNRVALLQGKVEIDSKPGRPTAVNIQIPLSNA
ncbi:signal transduction histidine kinase [Arcticibacter pallidicorallinus]|uniref:histidine kinase n=1 Tax=Arcticibacter pallidicorallinus TaxID=1259464 RepID=A0A2T0TU58_9SPHI|nr:sensor histidine kinase [Arcticibacter pallidicorallinus]PRY49199.1 signal transduction histidine kinase [Arcticibacter pallidicorallinus]